MTYYDLEELFVDATLYMGEDPRVTQGFLTWLIKYGIILSPCKLRRLLTQGHTYYPAVLGAFMEILETNNRQKKHWKILKRFTKKTKEKLLFAHLPPPRKGRNPFFSKFGLITYPFVLDEKKYLIPTTALLKQCPEIRHRAMGLGIPAADLRAFSEKHPDINSLYEIAKRTHHPRTSIYLSFQLFRDLGVGEGVIPSACS